ncbi:juvenile hormone esterase-like [Drosophila tropicalis]|uniref:juvenile hormone esterase-like n=1 Tax=Drosophila tropicalis TaxID=46794 RepID=UPI0035AC00D8
MNGYQKGPFEAFLGIPYAEPPVGPRRFRSPKIKARWFNTYDATKFKSDCIQKNYLSHNPTVFGEEDCLYLNIYRPKVRFRRLPVMIYIHGGGFFSGSAGPLKTGPEYIMDSQSVILVTMSYRLGALGFMSTGDDNMPGNFGLKDQNLVFKWVRRNIVSFDGNNKKVTIFGHGAGAVATHMHLINPYSKNLFHRVISMSGTANVPFAITTNPLEQARETAKLCAIPNADTLSTAKLTEALRNVNATTLINAGDGLKHWDGQPLTVYRPVVEPRSPDAVIPADPEKLMKRKNFQKRPWLLGTVPQEGAPHLPVVYLCLCLVALSAADNFEFLVVCPPKATCIRGFHMYNYDTEFEAFMGMPYALAPIGELRFRDPIKMVKLPFIIDGTRTKPDCIQRNYFLNKQSQRIFGEEDCLYLNIYRPARRAEILPVMVYIHGGGFNSGSSNYLYTGPEYIMATRSVILVTVSYRLGALGFLSTGDSSIPGNFGLKDQHMALKWVQENIGDFGGDKNKVTLFGHGAGAIATHLPLMNPNSNGLFHRVITMSGTANSPYAIDRNPLDKARKTAVFCNIQSVDHISTTKLSKALRKVNAAQLVKAEDSVKRWVGDPDSYYRPVIEPPGANAFLTQDPEELIRSVNYTKLPWLLGTVPEDGAEYVINIMENSSVLQNFNAEFHYNLLELIQFPNRFNATQKDEKLIQLVNDYFGGTKELHDGSLRGFLNLITERAFKHPLYNVIRYYLRNVDTDKHPFYMYSFNYKGRFSYASLYAKHITRNYGVVHGDDLLYVFRSPIYFHDFNRNSTEAAVAQLFVNYLVIFAKYGKPLNFPPLESCYTSVLHSRPEGICDYHEFFNAKHNFEHVRVNSTYPTQRVRYWLDLLEESRKSALGNPFYGTYTSG